MDSLFGNIGIVISAFLIAVTVTRLFNNWVIQNQINRNARWPSGCLMLPLLKYMIPIGLLVVLVSEIAGFLT